MPDDQELLVGLRARLPEAFRELFEQYSDRMFRLAAGMLGNDDEAEDVVQEAFIRFFEGLDDFRGHSQVGTWLYRTAHNASIDRLRRRRPILALSDDPEEEPEVTLPTPAVLVDWSTAPESLLDDAEAQQQLQKAVAALPERLRATFLLRDVEGLSTAEAAQVLGVSESAVKVWYRSHPAGRVRSGRGYRWICHVGWHGWCCPRRSRHYLFGHWPDRLVPIISTVSLQHQKSLGPIGRIHSGRMWKPSAPSAL